MTTGTAALVKVRTPKGNEAVYSTRDGTSDAALVGGIIGEDEYDLADLPELRGWAIDIGAHIGTVAVALALDNPDLRVIAVEALPENVETLRENVALNGLQDRIVVVEKAAGTIGEATTVIAYGWSKAINQPDGYMHDNRYIGGMVGPNDTSTSVECQIITLGECISIAQAAEPHPTISLLKIDCEGCEWFFLRSPEVWRPERIWGEFHIGKHGTAARLRELLEPTHDVEMDDTKVVGLFRATRR